MTRNMKYNHNMKPFSALILMAAALVACTRSEVPVQEQTPEEAQTVSHMVLKGGITLWDATKGDPVDWVDGQAIYIGLTNGTDIKKVVARYYASNNEWRISYDGSLADYSSGDCKCYYFVDKNYESSIVYLDQYSVIYADENAKFSIVGSELQISANLTPFTGRIKFVYPQYSNRSRYYPRLYGFSHYTQFDLSTFEFTSSDATIDGNQINSSTDTYYYVWYSNPDRTVTVWDGNYNDYYFIRAFKEGALDPGHSNWLYWPTYDYHNEWKTIQQRLDFDYFNFQYIIPGTFNMGGEDAQPIHQVTLTKPFYITRHEIRQTNWTDITGDAYDPDVWYNDSNYPVFGKSWDQVNSFVQLLNAWYQDRGYRFRLPTEAEWEYCAKSGLYKYDYKYCTTTEISNLVWDGVTAMPDEVWAWYSSSLGMNNISGNVSEWVSDWYADYTDAALTDPKGPSTGEKHIKRGGARNTDQKFLTVTYRDAEESDNSMAGFRLVLEVNQ